MKNKFTNAALRVVSVIVGFCFTFYAGHSLATLNASTEPAGFLAYFVHVLTPIFGSSAGVVIRSLMRRSSTVAANTTNTPQPVTAPADGPVYQKVDSPKPADRILAAIGDEINLLAQRRDTAGVRILMDAADKILTIENQQ